MSDSTTAATVLDKVRDLIQEKTRFNQDIVQEADEKTTHQKFQIFVTHDLVAHVENETITGLTSIESNYVEQELPFKQAEMDCDSRLELGTKLLMDRLAQSDATYDSIQSGLFLPAESKYWHLESCRSCSGQGSHKCGSCSGAGFETCYSCSGSALVICSQCVGSTTVFCSRCGGTGQIHQQVPFQVSSQVWDQASGQYIHGSHTEYRYETTSCTCSHGRVRCPRCAGTGRHNCDTCRGTGKTTCASCAGSGSTTCTTCAGSKKSGVLAWVNIANTPGYKIEFPDGADACAASISEKEGLNGIATQAQSLSLNGFSQNSGPGSRHVLANYDGTINIGHLNLACNEKPYHVIAYGKSTQWLTLDGMLENLLQADVESLQKAIELAKGEEQDPPAIEQVLLALKDVSASELNLDLIDASLSATRTEEHAAFVTPAYTDLVKASFFDAMRTTFKHRARQFWWQPFAAGCVAGLIVWLFSSNSAAAIVAAATATLGWLLFGFFFHQSLGEALGDPLVASRAISLAKKGKCTKVANAVVLLPTLVLAVIFWLFLPNDGPWSNLNLFSSTAAPSQEANQTPPEPIPPNSVPAPATANSDPKPQDSRPTPPIPANTLASTANQQVGESTMANGPRSPAVQHAIELRQSKNLVDARLQLQNLASANDATAFGPLAWMVLSREGGSLGSWDADYLEADKLATLALNSNQNDIWALSAHGEMLFEGWRYTQDVHKGLAELKTAANGGQMDAMHLLGFYYITGKFIPKDARSAREWFTKAANLGNPEDTYNLGLLEWKGEAAQSPDRAKACRLFKKAAAMGEERAKGAIKQC